MITMESWTEGIKFERHKEESLISSQFLKNQKKSKASHFLIIWLNKKSDLRPLYCEKRMILIFIDPFMIWGEKIGKWNNQSGFLGIWKGNLEALFFIT